MQVVAPDEEAKTEVGGDFQMLKWPVVTREPGTEHIQTESRGKGASLALTAIKAMHTLAWFSIDSCMIYLLYSGFRGKSDRRAGMAAAVVAGETLIFVGNRFRCPITRVAVDLGAERGGVTDIFLPRWFAHYLPAIHVPLLVLAAWLHGRTVVTRDNPPSSISASKTP